MLVSNFEVYLTKDGNGAISFTVGNDHREVIIHKDDKIPMQIFGLYHAQLPHFKQRHYAIASWIVRDIRRMGYVFKRMPSSIGVYQPVKLSVDLPMEYSEDLTMEEKLEFLNGVINKIRKKNEVVK